MNRMWAIVERELRKFFRSPALMLVSMVFPLVQLIVLGNAFGGKIKEARLGVVDQDQGTQSVKVREALAAVQANANTFYTVPYYSDQQAMEDVRTGKLDGAIVIPPEYSRRVYEQNHPRIALIVDNTDNFMSSTLESEFADLVKALNNPDVDPSRIVQQISLDTVELYPYIEYMKYLLPGSIALAMFVSVMIGGGMLYIDDKARGVHEGYLVTPITKFELVAGLNIAGAIKAIMAGLVITILGRAALRPGNHLHAQQHVLHPADDSGDLAGVQHHDVPDDGAGGRSAGAARHVWRAEHAAVFPQRRDLSHQGLSEVAAVHRLYRSVLILGARVQGDSAERCRLRGDTHGSAVPDGGGVHHDHDRDGAVQANAVRRRPVVSRRFWTGHQFLSS